MFVNHLWRFTIYVNVWLALDAGVHYRSPVDTCNWHVYVLIENSDTSLLLRFVIIS